MTGLRRIAYVEDEVDIRTLTEMSLVSIGGFEVTSFASAADALQGLAECAPDLILTDVMMPQMDGRELVTRLASDPVLSRVPTVFITARTLQSERSELMALGVAGIVAKPYDPMTLPDQICHIWANRNEDAPNTDVVL